MAISSSLVQFGITVGTFALLAIGLNMKFGYTGLLEIGHVAFYLIGAYVTALLVLPPAAQNPGQIYILGWSWPWIPAVIAGTLAAGILGGLVSLPAIRLREDYLAITLLGMAFIVQQIFRSERWLANGPRALAGYERPLADLFPLPGETLASALLLGAVIFLFWTVGSIVLASIGNVRNVRTNRDRLLHGFLFLTTLGVGYLAARRALRDDGSISVPVATAGGLVAGVAATLALLLTPPVLNEGVVLLFFGAFSVGTWALGGIAYARFYRELSLRDQGYGVLFAVAFLTVLVPLVILGSNPSELISSVGLVLTTILLGVFLWGLVRISKIWDRYSATPLIRIIGVGAVWLFLTRYWVLPLIQPVKRGGIVLAVGQLVQNLFWLVRFDPNFGIIFGYTRFLFLLVVTLVAIGYYVAEVTATSPFGRVLKAIREDEDVATALGKNTFSYKVQSMALGSAIAGMAGALTAIQFQALTWSIFRVEITFIVLLIVIIGGSANNRGAILGAAVYWAFARGTTDLAQFFPAAAGSSVAALRRVIIGALLIIILYYRPQGLWGEESGVTTE
ncbi:MAG: branched-chain amino acid ABC transporter permease [Halobacteriales archaeon]